MLRLLEITYSNDKESAALYDGFVDVTALTADFDTKIGAAMKAEAYKAEMLVAFDEKGKIYAQGYDSKDDTVTLSPRLVWVTADNSGESANQTKENDLNSLKADMYTKRGSAKKNADVKSIALIGIDGKGYVAFSEYWSRPIVEPEPQEQAQQPQE